MYYSMGTTVQYAILLLALLVFSCMQLHRCQGAPTFSCREDERKALLKFKDGLQATSGQLSSSWIGINCCTWLGVTCSNRTGCIIQLDLRDSIMGDEINPSLLALEFLDLSNNELLEGDSLYDALSKVNNLTGLFLSGMNRKGELQHWLNGDRKKIQYLDLSNNQLNGALTGRVGQLTNVVQLMLGHNFLSGVLTDTHFRNLTRLEGLNLNQNSLEIHIRPDWTPPQLIMLGLNDCKVGPAFPAWLRKIENISKISMYNTEISDVIPDWFWNFSLDLSLIDLSNNMIQGKLPISLQHLKYLEYLDLSSVQLEGPFPQFPAKLQELYLSNNSIFLPVPRNVSEIAANKLNGDILRSICKLKDLTGLELSGNQLSGEIPDCFDSKSELFSLDLSNNELSGTVPSSICSLSNLVSLKLESNNLSGPLPPVLQNCTYLRFIDLGNNRFSGRIPAWIGRMTNLITLRLKSNMFVGQIPRELGNLSYLGILDLSHNMLSGPIPQSFANLNAMKHSYVYNFRFAFDGFVDVIIKGRVQEYIMWSYNFPITIGLSSNNLSKGIPKALTTLDGLQNLNLSNNHLKGTIPMSIMGLQYLESLDLSFNNLTDEIPQTMADLYLLSYMNFSFNQLFGRIPTGGQFDNHPDPSIYIGNDGLCGIQLSIICGRNATSQLPQSTSSDIRGEDDGVWVFASAAFGYAIGFWTLVGFLLLKREWRIGYYGCIDRAYDKVYVFLVVNLISE